MKGKASRKGLENIVFVLVGADELNLPESAIDVVFMRNVIHHISHRVSYFRNLRKYLKPEGKVIIVEYKKGRLPSFRSFLTLCSKGGYKE